MQDLKIETRENEIKRKLDMLRSKREYFDQHTVAVYGTARNAERLIYNLDLAIVGLIDSKHTGEYFYGKKVLSEKEIGILGIDVIIIAAEPDPTEIIFKRISEFCVVHRISVFDLSGTDLLAAHRIVLQKTLDYATLTDDKVRNYLRSKKALLCTFSCLFEKVCSDEEVVKTVCKKAKKAGIDASEYEVKRISIQERLSLKNVYSLDDIYEVLTGCMVSHVDLEA